MMTPKTHDLMMLVTTSQALMARAAESRMMLALTSYTTSASSALMARPAMNRIHSVVFGMHKRTLGPYLATRTGPLDCPRNPSMPPSAKDVTGDGVARQNCRQSDRRRTWE
jgi:hypothetical protein